MQEQLGNMVPDILLIVCMAVGFSIRLAVLARRIVHLKKKRRARLLWIRALTASLLEFVDVTFMAVAVSYLLHYSYVVMPSLRLYGDPKVCSDSSFSIDLDSKHRMMCALDEDTEAQHLCSAFFAEVFLLCKAMSCSVNTIRRCF
jgi:hypothetical protein